MANLLEGIFNLGRNINKVRGDEEETKEGIITEPLSTLTLEKSNEELIELKKKWEQRWEQSTLRKEIEAKQKENEKYWLGDHYTSAQRKTGKRDAVDNLIFESLETFLPIATKQLAEPLISTVNDPQAKEFARKVMDKIVEVADVGRLRLKVKKVTRHWALYFLGCLKFGWSLEKNEMVFQVVRPQQLILDPEAITDEVEYEGLYIGHYRTDTAEDLILRFPNKKQEIIKAVGKENLGSKIRYIEWWTEDFVFWTVKDVVLSKSKNPHWNYDEATNRVSVNEFGEEFALPEQILGKNHFETRKIPFAFLSVFNLGKQPFDDTNPVEQVLPNQDIVNKRVRQIDKNADNTNGGAIVSGDAFTKEQAASVGEALRRGQTIFVPNGDVNRAYKRDTGTPLPEFVYQSLLDQRNEIRGIFGVTGLTPQGIQKEQTVRGKILTKAVDTDRAAMIIDHIEQFYDYCFNWMVQMMMVYYDEPRQVSRAAGDSTISSADFVWPLMVSVKEGSLIPHDRLMERNEAIDLWGVNAIPPIEFFTKLEFPNPEQTARNLLIWKMVQAGALPPQAMFPDFPITPPATIEQPQEAGGSLPEESQTVEAQLLRQVPI